MPSTDTKEQTATEPIFDGLVVIGRLVEVRDLKSSKTGNTVEGIKKITVASSRGDIEVTVMRKGRTMMGSFDLAAFDVLTNRQALEKNWVISVGEDRNGSFTSLVALDAKPY